MAAPTYVVALFMILVLDLMMNNGNGFRIGISILAYSVRQVGAATGYLF